VYTITVTNSGTAATTAGPIVQVYDTLPTGLTAVSFQGTGWLCGLGPPAGCNTGNALAAGASFPVLTLTVNVAANAPANVTNTASVSGGGIATTATANDPTTINPIGTPQCSISLSPASRSVPATGTAAVETCPNNSGQPSCGVYPDTPQSFTVTPSAACGPWTAISSSPGLLQVLSGASGSGVGSVSFAQLTNTHNGQQSNTITVASATGSATYTVTEAGNPDGQTYREIYALYEQFLGREPDAGGFAFWSGTGGSGLGQMADDFLTSPEFFNSGFAVMAAYQAATGAPPTYAQYTAAVASIRAARPDRAWLVQFADRLQLHILHFVPEPLESSVRNGGLQLH
jgi:hypothetical protein